MQPFTFFLVITAQNTTKGGEKMENAKKWYQGKIDKDIHAKLKAAAALNGGNIEDYINLAITEQLKRDGFFAWNETNNMQAVR